MSDLELRNYTDCRVSSDDGRKLKGYAIRFGSRSLDLGGFTEIIAPEAVDRTLNKGLDVRALVDHDSAKIIGRTRAGTLELRKDAKGLAVFIEPDDQISYARDIMRSVQRGDVSGMSFGFRTMPGGDSWDFENETPIRTLHDIEIREVSVVTFPAYPATSIDVAKRSLDEARPNRRSRVFLERLHVTRLAK